MFLILFMFKLVIAILLVAVALAMRIDEDDQFRNRTIVRVLAAYSSKCLVFNDKAGEFEYNSQVFLRRLLSVFLEGIPECVIHP